MEHVRDLFCFTICPKSLKLQSPFRSSPLEPNGLWHFKVVVVVVIVVVVVVVVVVAVVVVVVVIGCCFTCFWFASYCVGLLLLL